MKERYYQKKESDEDEDADDEQTNKDQRDFI